MYKHSEDFKLNHEFQLLSTVKETNLEIKQLKELNKKKDENISELKNDLNILNNKLEKVLEELSAKIESKEQLIDNLFTEIERNEQITDDIFTVIESNEQLTYDRFRELESNEQLNYDRLTEIENNEQLKNNRLTDIENNGRLTNNRLTEIAQLQTQHSIANDQFRKEIGNLNIFAERVSKLQVSLSEKNLQWDRHHYSTLFKEKYDKNNYVTLWNNTIGEANNDDNKCNYLKTLTKSMNQYKQTIYPSTYKERFENLVWSSLEGAVFNGFIRIRCYSKSFCVKTFDIDDEFMKEVEKNDRSTLLKVQNTPSIFSYHTDDCLHVVSRRLQNYHLYLLHNANSDGKQLITQSKEGNTVKDVSNFVFQKSIVIYLEIK